MPKSPVRRISGLFWAGGLAAAAVIAVLVLPRVMTRPERTAPPVVQPAAMTDEQIERTLQREAAAARLLASTRILLAQGGGEALAARTLDYIARAYGDTDAGRSLQRTPCTTKGATQ